jgi:hypothetical protein
VHLEIAPPPYTRICVRATVVVEDEMRMASSLQQLDKDLIRFLSPWPAPDLGARPKNYYEETAIGQFIRDCPYIRSFDSLELEMTPVESEDKYGRSIASIAGRSRSASPDASSSVHAVCYYTSALHHKLDVRVAIASKSFDRRKSGERR